MGDGDFVMPLNGDSGVEGPNGVTRLVWGLTVKVGVACAGLVLTVRSRAFNLAGSSRPAI